VKKRLLGSKLRPSLAIEGLPLSKRLDPSEDSIRPRKANLPPVGGWAGALGSFGVLPAFKLGNQLTMIERE